jgi:hypothetical protein
MTCRRLRPSCADFQAHLVRLDRHNLRLLARRFHAPLAERLFRRSAQFGRKHIEAGMPLGRVINPCAGDNASHEVTLRHRRRRDRERNRKKDDITHGQSRSSKRRPGKAFSIHRILTSKAHQEKPLRHTPACRCA